ncbi:MAG: hypothetical protein M1831_000189 [Alyxoria varia]|nr:MAG: hypothetical protein M1831_000189 [Alyxoria varia]
MATTEDRSAVGCSATSKLQCDVWNLVCEDLSLSVAQATDEKEAQASRAMLKSLSETDHMLHDLAAPKLLQHPRFGGFYLPENTTACSCMNSTSFNAQKSHTELVRAQLDSMALSPNFPQLPRSITVLPLRSSYSMREATNLTQDLLAFLEGLVITFKGESHRFQSLKRLVLNITRQDAQYLSCMAPEILDNTLLSQAHVLEATPREPQYLLSFDKVEYLVLHGLEGGKWATADTAIDLVDVMSVIKQMPTISHLEIRKSFTVDWMMILRELPRNRLGRLQTIALEATGDTSTDPRSMSFSSLRYLWDHLKHLTYLKPCSGGCEIKFCQPKGNFYYANPIYESMFVGNGLPTVSPPAKQRVLHSQRRERKVLHSAGIVVMIALLFEVLLSSMWSAEMI